MSVTGGLDVVEDGRIVGWAHDPARGHGAVEVFLWMDGRLAGRALANRLRRDLAQAGIAHGRSGFEFACSIPRGTREIRATIAAGVDLVRSPWLLGDTGLLAPCADHDRITILAIARNEGPYIEEWIAHHRAIGVDRFLIYDNASTDGTPDRLRANPAIRGFVEIVDWPSSRHLPTEGPQLPAYADALPELKRRGGWVAVIDIDEFIVPLADHNLPALLARFRDVPALSLCWKVFGSSGHSDRDDDRLVTERFRFAGRAATVKTIFRPATATAIECHVPRMETGTAVNELRRPVARRAASEKPTYRWGQVNHYFSKSWAEWEEKRARGRADKAKGSSEGSRPDDHFHGMDAASEYDLAIVRFRRAMLDTLADLFPERAERATRPPPSRRPQVHASGPLIPSPVRLWRCEAQSITGRAKGTIEQPPRSEQPIPVTAQAPLRVAGWLLDAAGDAEQKRLIFFRSADGRTASDYVVVLRAGQRRPDVGRHFPHLPERIIASSGFDVSIDIRSVPLGTYRLDLGVLFDDGAALVKVSRTIQIG